MTIVVAKPMRMADLAEAWIETISRWAGNDKSTVPVAQRAIGQRLIVDLAIANGRISGRYRRPDDAFNDMSVSVSPWTDGQWSTAVNAVGAKATHLATLLADDLDVDLDGTLRRHDLDVLPDAGELHGTCTCDEPDPCRHVLALAIAAARPIAASPPLLLLLRGRTVRDVVDQHRTLRRQEAGPLDADDASEPERSVVASAAGVPSRPLEQLPKVPAVAAVPGALTGWPRTAPPVDSDVDEAALRELAIDAVERAWEMSAGVADSRLGLAIDVDLARRAVGHVGSSRIIELAKLIDVDAPRVISLATAWETAGPSGLELLDAPAWYPAAAIMEEARQTIIDSGRRESSVRVAANTITVADKMQYRFGADHQWYRFELRSGHWHLFVPPAASIDDVLARKKKKQT